MNLSIITTVITQCKTYNEFYKKTGISRLKAKRLVKSNNIDISHFTPGIGRSTRGKKIVNIGKICKACNTPFNTIYKLQTFCSHKCSNSFEPHNPISTYQRICFQHHKRECIVCGENIIVEVHHYDKNHKNNTPGNLIPLCSTHHRYIHCKRGKHLIEDRVNKYHKNFNNI